LKKPFVKNLSSNFKKLITTNTISLRGDGQAMNTEIGGYEYKSMRNLR